MSFSSGTFSLVSGNPVVTGTTISSTVQNNTMNDVATGLTTCLLKDGTQTATATIPFAGITLTTSGGTASTLNFYEEYTAASAACTGAVTVTVVWKLTKIGNKVTLTLPQTIGPGVATTPFVYGTAIPARFRPSGTMYFAVQIWDNGGANAAAGAIEITAAGVISVYKTLNLTGNFTVTQNAGIDSTAVSWTI